MTETLVFYDGVCGLCDRFVKFLLRRDARGRFRFAPLQGAVAQEVLTPRGIDPAQLDSVVVVDRWQRDDARVFRRSRAVLEAVRMLDGSWPAIARFALLAPRPLADAVYRVVARYRYRVFGKLDACPIPPPEWRNRFLE